MKKEIIKKYNEEFQAWLDGYNVRWRYTDCDNDWSDVKADGNPFILDNKNIEYVIDDDMIEYRIAERDGKQIECMMHNSIKWIPISTKEPVFTQRSAKKYRIRPDAPEFKWQWIYEVLEPEKNGYDKRFQISTPMTENQAFERYWNKTNIVKYYPLKESLEVDEG